MPHKSKIKETLIFDGSANPSPATTNGALSTKTNNKGGVSSAITHVKNNVPSDFNVPQKKYTSKSYKVSHNKAYKAEVKTAYKKPSRMSDAKSPNLNAPSDSVKASSTSTVSQKKYTSKSYKASHNKAYKAITKNGIITVKDGARGKGILHENDEPYDPILYGRTMINVPIEDVTKAAKGRAMCTLLLIS